MDVAPALQRFDEFFAAHGLPTGGHDKALLEQALTHKSYAADFPSKHLAFNERMEFLGDEILGRIISDQLFTDYPDLAESELTLKKIYLVKEQTLAQAMRAIGAGAWIRLGNGEEKSGGRDKDVVLADLCEALIAYVRRTFGQEAVRTFILETIYSFRDDAEALQGKSYKSLLQEHIQKHAQTLPEYIDTPHETEPTGNVLTYRTVVKRGDKILGEGIAVNKKKAQEEAARQAYEQVKNEKGKMKNGE